MPENNIENQPHSIVKTFPEIQEVVAAFYDTLPGPVVGSFSREEKTAEQCEAFKRKIDEAQAIMEEIESFRLALDRNPFNAEELDDMNKAKLQKIAVTFGMKPKQSKQALVAELTGKPKSIPVLQTNLWKKEDELGIKKSALWGRMQEARDAYQKASGTPYPHPRQTAAVEMRG